MPKCQICNTEFEKEQELTKHQKDGNLCFNCCHKLCNNCNQQLGNVKVVICCQCGKTNY